MSYIKHTHGSGWYGSSPQLLERDLDTWAKDSNLITVTEVTPRERAKMLNEPGWEHYRGEKNKMAMNVAAVWKQDTWRLIHTETVQVTDQYYWTKKGSKRDPMAVIFVVLENLDTHKRLCLCVGHLPPSVEGRRSAPGGLSKRKIWSTNARRISVHVSATRGINRAQRRINKRFKCHARMIVADWNMNLQRATVRAYFKSRFPAMRPTFKGRYPATHGRRLIDFALINKSLRIVKAPRVKKKTPASDHKAFRQVLAFRR